MFECNAKNTKHIPMIIGIMTFNFRHVQCKVCPRKFSYASVANHSMTTRRPPPHSLFVPITEMVSTVNMFKIASKDFLKLNTHLYTSP